MSKQTKRQQSFVQSELPQRVRLATPLAQELVLLGLMDVGDRVTDQYHLCAHVATLIGHDGPDESDDDDRFMQKLEEFAGAAFALGVSAGLLLRPGALQGGAR